MQIKVLTAATATNSAPSGATAGFPLKRQHIKPGSLSSFSLVSTAGSGTMTVTCRVWVMGVSGAWTPLGPNETAASRGLLNDTNAIDEIAADTLAHTELLAGLENYDRIYVEITAIGGTATAVSAWIHGGE